MNELQLPLLEQTFFEGAMSGSGIVLSPEQEEIARLYRSDRRQNIAIKAGPGCGKSFMAKWLIQQETPGVIQPLLCAFNVRIVEELKAELGSDAQCKTIHQLGMSMLAAKFGRSSLEVTESDKYGELAWNEGVRISAQWSARHGREKGSHHIPPEHKTPQPPEPADIVSTLRKTLTFIVEFRLDHLHANDEIKAMMDRFRIAADYPDWVRDEVEITARGILQQGVAMVEEGEGEGDGEVLRRPIDFLDMIFLPLYYDLRPRRNFLEILIDECHDLSPAKEELVLRHLAPQGRVVCVGDPDQAINMFAGADPRSFERLVERLGATVLTLSETRRCAKAIVAAAAALRPALRALPTAPEGEILSLDPSADLVACLEPFDKVLCRKKAPLIGLCIRLMAAGRTVRLRGSDLTEGLIELTHRVEKMEGFDYVAFRGFLNEYVAGCLSRMKFPKGAKAEMLLDQAQGLSVCYSSFDCHSMAQLRYKIKEVFGGAVGENGDWLDRKPAIELMSCHSAKGLEAHDGHPVYILNFDCMPLEWQNQTGEEYQQELNVMYVALTRAKERLILVTNGQENQLQAGKKDED